MAQVDDLLLDLLDVVASVFAADSSIGRGGAARSEFGDGWRRSFRFTVPVRRLEIWSRPDVNRALTEAVSFLTDDDVAFKFTAGRETIGVQQYLDFDPAAGTTMQVDEVILFSGGLDSFSGALETLATTNRRVALVTHQSAQKLNSHQVRLAQALIKRFPGRVMHIPVKATRAGTESTDTTQRSRSLLFAALGHVIARMLNAQRISFYENGIVSQNLPISRQVIGSMATRTTHPLTLLKLQRFLDTLGGEPVPIENKFAWLTKTEVVAKIAEHGGASYIQDAVSCTSVREQDILRTHCGACSQCMDRRFATLAAGLRLHDPDEIYDTDVLLGPRESPRSRTIALDWTAHASGVADMDFRAFTERYISELSRIGEGYPDQSTLATATLAFALQKRHGLSVQAVLQHAIETSAAELARSDLSPSSLLKMFLAKTDQGLALPIKFTKPFSDATHSPVVKSKRDRPKGMEIFPLQVAFETDQDAEIIVVKSLGTVRGQPASIAHGLKPFYDQDIFAGRSVQNHRFVQSRDIILAKPNSTDRVNKDAVRKAVERCRTELAALYRIVEDSEPPRHLLIETGSHSGYRLDPTCKVIVSTEI